MSTTQTGLRANHSPPLAPLGSGLGQVHGGQEPFPMVCLHVLPGLPESHSTFMLFALSLYYPPYVLGVWALPGEKS